MTPRERWLGVMRGAPVDRVPLMLESFVGPSPADVSDPSYREIAARVQPHTAYSLGFPSGSNRYLVTPSPRMRTVDTVASNGDVTVTTEIDTPKGPLTAVTGRNAASRTTWTLKYPVESLADVEKIRSVPWERPPEAQSPDLSNVPADFAARGYTHTGVSSPFVCVAGMMPFEYFLELCATEFSLLQELTAICLERELDLLDAVLADRKIEYVWMGGSEWLTPPMGSPEHYRVLVHEPERKIIERVHAAGAVAHVHCHGNIASTLELVIARRADYVEPMEPPPDGDITLADAKALAAGRITLGGNVEARILETGTPDEVEAATRAAFEGGTDRMVLSTTAGPICAMDAGMRANYHRMIDVWEELSSVGESTV